mmetsp:Transcript_10768/g.15760  ORF Transcript_10768/g.15760 Transcript_10768/m.15760 type:complete len:718 (-) Transcript_10768:3653-5806(-)
MPGTSRGHARSHKRHFEKICQRMSTRHFFDQLMATTKPVQLKNEEDIKKNDEEKNKMGMRGEKYTNNNKTTCSYFQGTRPLYDWFMKDIFEPVVEEVPTMYPNKQEWENPHDYLNEIKPQIEKYGMCKIVAPKKYRLSTKKSRMPMNNLEFQFQAKIQNVHQLQYRRPCQRQKTLHVDDKVETMTHYWETFFGEEEEKHDAFVENLEINGVAQLKKLKDDESISDAKQRLLNQIHPDINSKDFGFPRTDTTVQVAAYGEYAASYKKNYMKQLNDEYPKLPNSLPKPVMQKLARQGGTARLTDINYFDETKQRRMSTKDVIQNYWRTVERFEKAKKHSVMYGSDVNVDSLGGTLFPKSYEHEWNLKYMPQAEDSLLYYLHQNIPGISSPMIYVGCMFASFCWHTEDNYLPATNHIHYGEDKTWYCIPATAAIAFERALRHANPRLFQEKPNLTHEMITQFSPRQLQHYGVPVYSMKHNAGTTIVTMPRVYHAGFNHGFNIAESVNVAPSCSIPYMHIAKQNYRRIARPSAYAHEKIFFNMNIEAFDYDTMKMMRTAYDVMMNEELMMRKKVKDLIGHSKALEIKQKSRFSKSSSDRHLQFCRVCKQDCFLSCVVCRGRCQSYPLSTHEHFPELLKLYKYRQSALSKPKADFMRLANTLVENDDIIFDSSIALCLHHVQACKCPPSERCLLYRHAKKDLLAKKKELDDFVSLREQELNE